MNHDTIKATIYAAEEFLAKARAVLVTKTKHENSTYVSLSAGPKLTGALRRASMELTRALAEMRRP